MTALIDQIGLFQVILDGALLVCLIILIAWMRRGRAKLDAGRVYQSTEEFVAASDKLAAIFEKNLSQKKTLINELLDGLDNKTTELRALLAEADQTLERLSKAAREEPRPVPLSKIQRPLTDKEKSVLQLYDEGLPAARIAAQLRLAKGEVELILGLHKRT